MKIRIALLGITLSVFTFAQDLTVERIWKSGEFYGKGVEGFTSLADGEHFTKIVQEGTSSILKKYTFKDFSGKGEDIVNLSELKFNGKALQVDDATLSPSGQYVIIQTDTEGIYRHSYLAQFYLYNVPSKTLRKMHNGPAKQTLATLSPDERNIAYVSENNLFVFDLGNSKNKQFTNDGKINSIINGTTDWVYEEEFAITQGFLWSPDSKYIGYMRFDESNVKQFQMAMYGELYPEEYIFKYPKAGEDNSKVTFHIASLLNGESAPVDLGVFEYLPRFKWSTVKNEIVVLTMNRHQSELKYHLIQNPDKPADKVIYTETSDTYIDIDDNLTMLKDGKSLLRTSEKDGYNHIYLLNFDGTQKAITTGKWDVIELYGIDEKKGIVYYSSAENGAMNKTIYSITLKGKKTALSPLDGTHDATFSTGFNYFIKQSSWANKVSTFSLCDKTGKTLRVLEDNQKLQSKLDGMNLSKKEFISLPGVAGDLNAWIMKPANFDPNKKYPVYFNVYCGPGSNMVSNSFGGVNYMYHQLLTQKGYIVISVDTRGTMYRGAAFKKSTYKELGKLETEDLIAVAKNVQTWSYVDPTRIGIQGWSYGGFMTSLAMTKGADVFKTGIAVAPVTNWRYYDNIYTERFMQTPAENASGYDDNSPVNHADKLKGKFLLIHGSADDNVHYQNTMEFITALVKANKQFDLFIYPDKNHGIYGGNTRNHLFNMMLNYTINNL